MSADGGHISPEVALVLNPVSRRAADAVVAVERACADAGLGRPLVLSTTPEDPGPGQAREAVARGARRIVVAGGDGTVRLVAGELAGLRVDLGVVPVGTANLFARSALLPTRDLDLAARTAVGRPGRATDLGRAVLTAAGGGRSVHPFLVVAGLGHDAATLAAVTPELKERLRWLAYLVPGLRRLGRSGHALGLTLDGQPVDAGPLWSILAVNTARLPAGARVVPGARLDDGVLHAVLVAPTGARDWARIAATGLGRVRPRAGARYPGDHAALRYREARTVHVRSPEPVLAQVDGDVIPDIVGAELTILPAALRVAR